MIRDHTEILGELEKQLEKGAKVYYDVSSCPNGKSYLKSSERDQRKWYYYGEKNISIATYLDTRTLMS